MGWRLRIEHVTRVNYAGPVLTSFNEARMTPLTLPRQITLESRVTVGPGPVPVWVYVDYWGTFVSVFDKAKKQHTLAVLSAVRRHRAQAGHARNVMSATLWSSARVAPPVARTDMPSSTVMM